MMDRRKFGTTLLAGFAACRPALAQRTAKRALIGVMTTAGKSADMLGPAPLNTSVRALLQGMKEHGYVLDRDFEIVPRGGQSEPERFAALAEELVRLSPNLIIAPGPMLPQLKLVTSSIPIVMAGALDPVGEGFIKSLARPGDNFTGLSSQSIELSPKRLALLKEVAPVPGPVAILWDKQSRGVWQAAAEGARLLSWPVVSFELTKADDPAPLFEAAVAAGAVAVMAVAAASLFGRARFVAELAGRNRLPAMYVQRHFVEAGGLMSYAPNLNEIWRRTAHFADLILKGARPADIPVEQPTTFELVVNLKTARALGLALPPAILLRADEVIE